jgi:hypothetical protein
VRASWTVGVKGTGVKGDGKYPWFDPDESCSLPKNETINAYSDVELSMRTNSIDRKSASMGCFWQAVSVIARGDSTASLHMSCHPPCRPG